MPDRVTLTRWVVCWALVLAPLAGVAAGAPASRPTLAEWLASRGADAAEVERVTAARRAIAERAPVDLPDLREAVALVAGYDPALGRLLSPPAEGTQGPGPLGAPGAGPDPAWPAGVAADAAVLLAAEPLGEQRYERCLKLLDAIPTEAGTAPLLADYFRMVACHHLVRPEEAAPLARRLAQGAPSAPRRVAAVARLVERASEGLEPGSIEHVALQMNDAARRLALGQSGAPSQRRQRQVIEALDKLIDDLEEQRKQQEAASQQAQGQARPSGAPMEESTPQGERGEGLVDDKPLGGLGAWGSLPPAERQRVTQELSQGYPGHYQQTIEAYFRSLAEEPTQTQGAP